MAAQGDIKHQQFVAVKGYLMNFKCKYRLYNPRHDSLYASASLVCAYCSSFKLLRALDSSYLFTYI